MSQHNPVHEERVMEHVFCSGASELPELVAQIVGCEECFTFAFRLAENLVVASASTSTPSHAAGRIDALLEEVMVWRAASDDAPSGAPAGSPAEAQLAGKSTR